MWISVNGLETIGSTLSSDNQSNCTLEKPQIVDSKIEFSKYSGITAKPTEIQKAQGRLFPIGSPDLIPQSANLISPFDPATFSQQLLPLISHGVKEKVKSFARNMNDKASALEYALQEEWKQSPFNPDNFNTLKQIFNPYKLIFPHPPLLPTAALFKNPHKTIQPAQQVKPLKHVETFVKGKYPKSLYKTNSKENEQPVNVVMKELGIDSYRHFEDQILRDIEKQEEMKVEATLHTLYDDSEVVSGKPYQPGFGWKPFTEPTKNYDADSGNSQIISPLHTSIVGNNYKFSHEDAIQHPSIIKNHQLNHQNSIQYSIDHDQDSLTYHNPFKVHKPYEIHEDTGESKLKPIQANFDDVPVTTHKPKFSFRDKTTKSTKATKATKNSQRGQQRKRQKDKPASLDNVDIKPIEPNDIPNPNQIPTHHKARDYIRHHIQSLTTVRPRYHTENHTLDPSPGESKSHAVIQAAPVRNENRLFHSRLVNSASTLSHSGFRGTTSTTTPKPSRNFPRSLNNSRFIDKPKVTGQRGSIKFADTKKDSR